MKIFLMVALFAGLILFAVWCNKDGDEGYRNYHGMYGSDANTN